MLFETFYSFISFKFNYFFFKFTHNGLDGTPHFPLGNFTCPDGQYDSSANEFTAAANESPISAFAATTTVASMNNNFYKKIIFINFFIY